MTALDFWKDKFGEPQTDAEQLAVAMMADYAEFLRNDSETKKTFDMRIIKNVEHGFTNYAIIDEKYRKSQRDTVAEWESLQWGAVIESCNIARWLDTQDLKPGKSKVIKVTFETHV